MGGPGCWGDPGRDESRHDRGGGNRRDDDQAGRAEFR